jgi:epoxyqueuosine reductase QueG
MGNCNSVIAFAIYVGPDYYRTLRIENKITGEDRIMHIFRDWLQFKVAEYLLRRGHNTVVPTGYFNREALIPRFPFKLAAYEAGLGVYGRRGIIITP